MHKLLLTSETKGSGTGKHVTKASGWCRCGAWQSGMVAGAGAESLVRAQYAEHLKESA